MRCAGGLLVWTIVASVAGCNRPPAGPASEPLTQAYSTQNGLITAHYPAAFAATVGSPNRIQLNRSIPDTSLSLTALETPSTNDVNEFARVTTTAIAGAMQGYQELSRSAATCNGVPGVRVQANVRGDAGTPLFWSACAFLHNGHGYIFLYVVSQADAPTWAPLLQSILDATTFNR